MPDCATSPTGSDDLAANSRSCYSARRGHPVLTQSHRCCWLSHRSRDAHRPSRVPSFVNGRHWTHRVPARPRAVEARRRRASADGSPRHHERIIPPVSAASSASIANAAARDHALSGGQALSYHAGVCGDGTPFTSPTPLPGAKQSSIVVSTAAVLTSGPDLRQLLRRAGRPSGELSGTGMTPCRRAGWSLLPLPLPLGC